MFETYCNNTYRNPFPLSICTEKKNVLSEVNTADPIFFVKEYMDGDKEAIYYLNLIHLLDKVIIKNNLYYLSIDQERFIKKFFEEAGIVDNLINLNNTNPYENMDDVMKQLDNFLGSYIGVEYNYGFIR